MTENTGKMRILMIITVSCSRNGITAAALNEIASSDSSFLTIDLVAMNEPEEPVRSIVEGKGGRVYVLPSRNKHPLSYLKQLKKLLKDNSYTGIHVHGNSATMALDLMLAKRCGVPVRVSHGHNTKTSFPILHRIFLPLMLSTANRYAACGRAAGEWLYGGRNFTVLPNAINSEQFSFSKEDRELCRKEYRIPDTARVILHVGSFNAQKNHAFLLDAFFKIAAKDPLAYLVLLGTGKEMESMKVKSHGSGFEDRILFCGSVSNPACFYSAADCFVLPSLHEGLPFTAIEAQCSGLNCLLSDAVTTDADLTGQVQFLPLSGGPDAWAEAIEKSISPMEKREEKSGEAVRKLSESGYVLLMDNNPFMNLYRDGLNRIRKLLIVTHKMTRGGCERVISVLADRFMKMGIDVVLVSECCVESEYPLPENLRVRYLLEKEKMKALDVPKAYRRLYRIALEEKPDLILAMPEKVNVWTVLFLMPLHVPVVVSERNDPRHHPENRIKRAIRWMVYPFAKGFVFQTEDARNYFSRRIQRKGIVLNNPLNLELLPDPGCVSREKTVVSVGRLNSQKNYELLLEAFAAFRTTHKEWRLTIYGEGEEREKLMKQAEKLRIAEQVSFPGITENPAERIRDAGMFILSSDYEGMPNSLIEAMAVGLPCIATDCPCGGPRELIQDGKNGLLVAVGEREDLARAMCRLADDPAFAQAIGTEAAGIRYIMDADRVAEEWRRYFEYVAEQ